jgi:lysophospholipase L1-like esterase
VVFRELFAKQIVGLPLGIAGDRCNNLLFRLQHGELANNLNPKVWWILIGTNDLDVDHCSIESIVAGIYTIIQEIQRRRPTTQIIVNSILPRTNSRDGSLGSLWGDITQINHHLECLAHMTERVEFFNATELFLRNDTAIDLNLMRDRLHPSAAGSRLWGTKIVDTVLRIMST